MEIKINDDNGFELDEYDGKFSLMPTRKGYKQWAKYRKGKDEYQEKDWPVKVILGDREQAIRVCKEILQQLESDVPF